MHASSCFSDVAFETDAVGDTQSWKRDLRGKMRRLMRSWSGDPSVAVPIIAGWLEELFPTQNPTSSLKVAMFHPLAGEPDLTALLKPQKLQFPVTWGFPRVLGEELVFHEVNRLDALISGAYGIREPREDSPVINVESFDVFLCPGLAFSAAGARLGRGKGFYDRMLARARPDAVKIGVGLDFQWVEELPVDPHDVPMNRICCGTKTAIPTQEGKA